MEYIEVAGFNGGLWYYLPAEKHLFKRKDERNGNVYLTCYDSKDTAKMKREDLSFKPCMARCILKNKLYFRTGVDHNNHGDHEITFRDLISLNAMKDRCRFLAEHFPHSSHKISIKEIFLLEMAK